MGLLYYGNKDLNDLYLIMPFLLATFIWGGIITGLGYCLMDKESKIDLSINRLLLGVALFFIVSVFVDHGMSTGIPLYEFFTNMHVIPYYIGPFIVITLLSLIPSFHLF